MNLVLKSCWICYTGDTGYVTCLLKCAKQDLHVDFDQNAILSLCFIISLNFTHKELFPPVQKVQANN